MEITAIDQEVNDYDWFAIDEEGNIGHFASGGGTLPHSVSASAENLQALVVYFQSLRFEENNYSLSPAFVFPESIKTAWDRSRFLESYAHYSAVGLYSFDRNEMDKNGKWSDIEYRPITIPNNPSSINQLPIAIQNILVRTRYNGSFSTGQIVSLLQFQAGLQ